MPALFGNVLIKPNAREYCCYPGPEPRAYAIILDRIAQDVANLLLRAVSVFPRAKLQFHLYVIVEVTNNELGHIRPPCLIS